MVYDEDLAFARLDPYTHETTLTKAKGAESVRYNATERRWWVRKDEAEELNIEGPPSESEFTVKMRYSYKFKVRVCIRV